MRSGQAGRHRLVEIVFSRCRRPRNSCEYCPRTIAWFTVTACTVSGQRALRIWNQRSPSRHPCLSRTRNDIHGTVARKRRVGRVARRCNSALAAPQFSFFIATRSRPRGPVCESCFRANLIPPRLSPNDAKEERERERERERDTRERVCACVSAWQYWNFSKEFCLTFLRDSTIAASRCDYAYVTFTF